MKSNLTTEIDNIDIQILELLIQNHNNKYIAKTLKIPLSTIQRRVRKLVQKDFVVSKTLINFTKFGFNSGSLHIYLNDGDIDTILEKVARLTGVNSLEAHIGNSDIICEVIYKEGRDLLNLIANIKKVEGVEKIVWSERIFEYPIKSSNISLLEVEPSR